MGEVIQARRLPLIEGDGDTNRAPVLAGRRHYARWIGPTIGRPDRTHTLNEQTWTAVDKAGQGDAYGGAQLGAI